MQKSVVFISLFCQKTGLVLNLKKYESKHSSEIKEVQKQCQRINIDNIVMNLDALHCQKETTKIITEAENNYLIAVKKNQPSLYRNLEKRAKEKPADSEFIKQDNSHGRKIERKGKRGKKEYEKIMYYISSKKEKAEVFLEKIKDHWKIENQLHWVKDMVMDEDKSQIKDKDAGSNISVLKTIGLNLFRLLEIDSITQGRRWLLARGLKVLHSLE